MAGLLKFSCYHPRFNRQLLSVMLVCSKHLGLGPLRMFAACPVRLHARTVAMAAQPLGQLEAQNSGFKLQQSKDEYNKQQTYCMYIYTHRTHILLHHITKHNILININYIHCRLQYTPIHFHITFWLKIQSLGLSFRWTSIRLSEGCRPRKKEICGSTAMFKALWMT